MAVCCHREEIGKLLVAEKNGLIHLYNILSRQAILSLDSGCIPLMSADWSPSSSLHVAAIAAGELLVWDISRPRWWKLCIFFIYWLALFNIVSTACDTHHHWPDIVKDLYLEVLEHYIYIRRGGI